MSHNENEHDWEYIPSRIDTGIYEIFAAVLGVIIFAAAAILIYHYQISHLF